MAVKFNVIYIFTLIELLCFKNHLRYVLPFTLYYIRVAYQYYHTNIPQNCMQPIKAAEYAKGSLEAAWFRDIFASWVTF